MTTHFKGPVDSTGGFKVNGTEVINSSGAIIGDIQATAGSIGLTELASAIQPAYVVKYAGQFTTAGGDANESATVSGVLATDIAIASIEDNGTNNVTLLQTAAATDAVNFTMSADPSTDCIINYMVLRATS